MVAERKPVIHFPLAGLQAQLDRERRPAGGFVKTNDFKRQTVVEEICCGKKRGNAAWPRPEPPREAAAVEGCPADGKIHFVNKVAEQRDGEIMTETV